ncbi:cation transporter [Motiliproteus sp. SC1-56]|uniref:cation transporter n=1 Tax=Motiliproteus sp. SC1-56 TaxID=2799565 RepID=UPI001A8DA5CA|nr:cation transporter [Motiliproteus sp. SC1-56]
MAASSPARIIKIALASYSAGGLFKLITGLLTGSAALVSEALHSLLDAVNQVILYRGTPRDGAAARHVYAYGGGQMHYRLNLWSAVGLFSIGCGLGLAWALLNLLEIRDGSRDAVGWPALLALTGALLIQGYSLWLAATAYLECMRDNGENNPIRFLQSGGDITLSVIVVQSTAGLAGLLLAGLGILLTWLTGNPLWDALAALLVAILMGAVAFYLGALYLRYLTDVRDRKAERALEALVAARPAVHHCEKVQSLIMDDHRTLLFADIVLAQDSAASGLLPRILTEKKYLLSRLPPEQRADQRLNAFVTARASMDCALKRAELIAAELEQSLREQLPQVAEVSIRVRGLSDFALPKKSRRKPPPSQDAEYIERQ